VTCKNCQAATEAIDHRWFDPSCVYCGARYIQLLGRRGLTPTACRDRRRHVLATWMEHGHSEDQLRALAKGPHCTGPAKVSESDRPSTTKRRSPGTR
jgi:hypothetical protein